LKTIDRMSSATIRAETAADCDAVREVNRLAFGQEAEGRLVDRLRADGYVRVSLVAELDGRVVGHILFSDLTIITATEKIPAAALAPMAVIPDVQRKGIGSALVRTGLEACRMEGIRAVLVLGHLEFYPRFGFSAQLAQQIDSPYAGDHFMALELTPGALADVRGRVTYPPPFEEV